MKSMTGFGRKSNAAAVAATSSSPAKGKATKAPKANSASAIAVDLDVSVRAVNGRYLEMRFHLPREYAGLESDFKQILGSVFARGTLDIYVARRSKSNGPAEVAVNTELAREWLKSYRLLGKELKLSSEPTLEMLTRIPEVLHVETRSELTDAEKKLAKQLLKEAAEACDSERLREGAALEQELSRLCGKLEELKSEMETMKADARAELERRYRDRMRDGLQKLGFEGKVDDQRIAQEIVIQMDRGDIAEELQRLSEHLKAYRQLLKSKDSQGKKLDFYAQELLREVNTIGSKSHIARLTSLVVEAKTLVERIREQVQNVE